MGWEQAVRPVVRKLGALLSVARLEAGIAFASMLIAGVAAWQSYESAADAKEKVDRAERQVRAAEEAAQQVKVQAAAAERQALAAEKSSAEARDLVNATRSLRDEAARSIEVAKDQLAQTRADSYAMRRARVRIVTTRINPRVIGRPISAVMSFVNMGQEEPKSIRLGGMIASHDPKATLPRLNLPSCEKIPLYQGNWMEGHFWQESRFDWDQTQEDSILKGQKNLYNYGRMCYLDSGGVEHVVDFCTVDFGLNGGHQCSITDP